MGSTHFMKVARELSDGVHGVTTALPLQMRPVVDVTSERSRPGPQPPSPTHQADPDVTLTLSLSPQPVRVLDASPLSNAAP